MPLGSLLFALLAELHRLDIEATATVDVALRNLDVNGDPVQGEEIFVVDAHRLVRGLKKTSFGEYKYRISCIRSGLNWIGRGIV